ncbi:MAG: hypothetical protein JZU50_10335 [Desulfobulbaceae bacterium]|jgi:hypothetical protein|nr:hypothetical protein [Desulfobulbaceae bacterium]
MKNRTMIPWGLLLLVLITLAGQPQKAQARDNVYIGADLGGLVMAFNTYPRYEYRPPPCPPPRGWYPRDRYYPPPVVYGRPHYRSHRADWNDYPRHRRDRHWRGDRW